MNFKEYKKFEIIITVIALIILGAITFTLTYLTWN